jgi:small subunit ribosomal protein S27Ae
MPKKKTVKKKEKGKRVHRANKSRLWEVKDGKVIRLNRTCPRCGEAVYLAKHYNRMTCGKCGYTKFAGAGESKSSSTKTVGGVKRSTRRRRIQR